MKDTALQRVAREPHAGKQKAERRALFLKSQSHASVIDLPLIQRTPFCACGGGCPRCEKSALPIQTKLRISAPADEYEQEADRVAEQVMRMPQPAIQRASCASCEVGGSTSPECEANEKDLVQRKAATPSSHKGASVPNNFLTAPGIGQPLDSGTRAFMEERFGHDFGHVRVHTDARAAESARDVAAKAYTVGSDIVFGQGRFAPTDGDGLALLAHELAHVVQQSASPSPLVAHHTVPHIARAPLDVDAIVKDVEGGSVEISPFAALMSLPFIKSLTQGIPSGDITMAADYPTSFTLPADKTKPVAALPKADSQPPLSNIPVVAHFFPAIWAGTADRALVIGGFHGDERPGWEIAEKLVSDFNQAFTSNVALAFHTIVIPRLNA
ncbi:MAG TPA: DUF4157 domain-containing protein, partial [Pyrinomonadaceae bacterium]|nr:DUF4157 domain-containing protein [Pyrinomonadaceae bacterium]